MTKNFREMIDSRLEEVEHSGDYVKEYKEQLGSDVLKDAHFET